MHAEQSLCAPRRASGVHHCHHCSGRAATADHAECQKRQQRGALALTSILNLAGNVVRLFTTAVLTKVAPKACTACDRGLSIACEDPMTPPPQLPFYEHKSPTYASWVPAP